VIESCSGDILAWAPRVQALVNPVNTVGVMGKGLALQFKNAWPDNFVAYRDACNRRQVKLGKMFVHTSAKSPLIINFPTKDHWRQRSQLDDIATGLDDLIAVVQTFQIQSIAIPPLGCGLGGLNWQQVKPLIVTAFEREPEVQVYLFEPHQEAGGRR
jgi:O-acetyl-ADP-ribose deacetylase (regulator of RNase III)